MKYAGLWRVRSIITVAVLAMLALGSFWLYEVLRRAATDVIPSPERSEPDFYVEKFSYVKLSKTGAAHYHFSGARLTHNPKDDSYDITQPVVRNLSNPESPMIMRADRARVSSDNSEVHLYDDVRLDRPGTATAEPMHISSEYLLLLPDDDVMKTDKPVEITFGRSRLTGAGMFANNATREFTLSSNVHGTYQPPLR
ncbi:MAG TPA: LPS export ABC transporter periplasmic protein LptC [Noviherbaspirillum sp.]